MSVTGLGKVVSDQNTAESVMFSIATMESIDRYSICVESRLPSFVHAIDDPLRVVEAIGYSVWLNLDFWLLLLWSKNQMLLVIVPSMT